MAHDIHTKIRLAREFGSVIQAWLSSTEFHMAVDRNKAEEVDSPVCHTHDFCDANMAMLQAFQTVMGREPAFLLMSDETEDVALWGDAWAIAKAADFFA